MYLRTPGASSSFVTWQFRISGSGVPSIPLTGCVGSVYLLSDTRCSGSAYSLLDSLHTCQCCFPINPRYVCSVCLHSCTAYSDSACSVSDNRCVGSHTQQGSCFLAADVSALLLFSLVSDVLVYCFPEHRRCQYCLYSFPHWMCPYCFRILSICVKRCVGSASLHSGNECVVNYLIIPRCVAGCVGF